MKTIARFRHIFFSITFATALASCGSLEREIDIDLPPHSPMLNVEAYILTGTPVYAVFLTETAGYFDKFDLPVVEDALVTVRYAGFTDTLQFGLPVIGGDTLTPVPVYYGFRSETRDLFDSAFVLNIADKKGRRATATTRLLRPVVLEPMEWTFNDEGKRAYLLNRFRDPGEDDNYFRFVLQRRENDTLPDGTVRRISDIQQAFPLTDQLQTGGLITLGTGFDYREGDTVTATIYHIEKAYFDYLTTADGAVRANLSPFGQPTRVISNVQGGFGIFTAISPSVREAVIRR